jgi:hypothetical protein
MTGWVWAGIIIGLAIVALAVGTPYVLTHKNMRSPHDVSDSHGYLRATRRWRRRRGVVSGPPGQASGRVEMPGSLSADDGPSA